MYLAACGCTCTLLSVEATVVEGDVGWFAAADVLLHRPNASAEPSVTTWTTRIHWTRWSMYSINHGPGSIWMYRESCSCRRSCACGRLCRRGRTGRGQLSVLCGPLSARSTRYRSGRTEESCTDKLEMRILDITQKKQCSKHVTISQLKAWWDDSWSG